MKPYHQQTYYEVLEISPDATQEEIRAAYERVSQSYAPDSVAIYSLADPAQAEDLRKRIFEAFEYLSEPELRRDYDRSIGLPERPEQPTVSAPAAPVVVAPPVPNPVEPRGDERAESVAAEASSVPSQPPQSSEDAVESSEGESAPELVNRAPTAAAESAVELVSESSTAAAESAVELVSEPSTAAAESAVELVSEPSTVAAESATAAPISAEGASGATSAPTVSEQSPAPAASSSAAAESATAAPMVSEPSSAPQPESAAPELPPEPKSTPRAKPQAAPEAPASTESKPPAADESPAQISMQELLRRSERAATSSNLGNVSVSYIPHPPRPERAEPMTLAAPSWAPTEASAAPASTPTPRTESSERAEAPASPPAVEPPPLPRAKDRASELKPRRAQQLAGAAEIAQESAIASAEAALAQVSARARENRPNKPLEIPPDAEFNGELLRKIRQAKNLTIQQVADRTRIGRNHLENVEADRYDALPMTVYLRGILMNIAREYGLDPLRVSKSYLALVPSRK